MTEPTRIGARALAERLGLDPPTDEQCAIVESALQPALVVAGAGSGKTETMALRVLWLVANGLVRPEQVLGLTFTRKAAGELGERMRRRIGMLRGAGLVPEPAEGSGSADPAADLLDAPVVSTYNSFAGAVFRENAALLGQDGDGVVLSEASAWLLAREVVLGSDDARLADLGKRVDDIASAVVRVASAIAENVADPAAVTRMAGEFAGLARLEDGPSVDDLVGRLASLPVVVDLAVRFDALKRERGYQQFSDQLATALRVIQRHPRVGEALRDRYRVVILDEYQDTSVVQSRVLSLLFRDHPVMAVGDPHQAIYGWRGASASNLRDFPEWFGGSTRFALSVSWRNGERILEAANRVIEPLAVSEQGVARLRARPGADAVDVDLAYPQTVADEAREVAEWFKARLEDRGEWRSDEPPSAALLLRARSTLEHFTKALAQADVPYHVLGVGGLLAQPAIADLVAALAVVDDPGAGSELIRLLVGSRWRIGLADIAGLREVARWLERRDLAQRELPEPVREALRASVVDEESASIVDALDFLAHTREGHLVRGFVSEEGLARLVDAGRLFAMLRSRARLDLADLVTVVIEALELDIEVEANDAHRGGDRAFEAFFEALQGFQALGQGASLRAFLGWLRVAEARDRLTPRSDPPEAGCVQIVTIHGAKGLEWDLVAVPRMVTGELPRSNRDSMGWVAFGQLPYEFRGDAGSLPVFAWRGAATRRELKDRLSTFTAEVHEERVREDRRLAYVAMTRARRRLLLSGSFWSSQKAARMPSPFLTELAEAGIVHGLPEAPDSEENPLVRTPDVVLWPRDPLGARRARVEAAAQRVRAAEPVPAGEWAEDLELLIAERRDALAGRVAPVPPARIPASRFSEFVTEPEAVAERLLRPMPEKPYRATRLGTLFHAWVEHRALGSAARSPIWICCLTESDDELVGVDAERLAALQATFEASPWADRQPVEVEREIHLPFDGRIVICKIDAVYADGDGGFEVVDWKTGKAPRDEADLNRKQLQLALYRLAYARWAEVPVERIGAAFYFVADDTIVRPEHIDDEAELLARWRAAFPDG
ncbi:MAG: ATP-dependent DNA helicase [Schumannella sp.]